MVTVGPREKAIFCQTLAPLVKGLERKDLIVELKNDIVIFGCLELVDCFMNLTMTNVLMTRKDGKKYHFEFFFLQRKSIRYIRIPNNISVPSLLKTQVDIATGKAARDERSKAKEKRANWLKKKHLKNMAQGDLAPIVVETTALSQQEEITQPPTSGTISVISEETNETVRVIYEKNIRAVSDAVEGYVIPANPLNACEAVDPAPVRKSSVRANGNASTEDTVFAFEDDGRIERDWVLLSIVYDCDVTTKARNAQLGGYKALIIQNIGSNDSQHIPWHILRFPLVKLNHVLVGEYDGDLLRFNFSYPNNRYYVKFEEDKFYQLMCYILIGIIIVLLSTMFALFWFQICCAVILIRWLHPGKRRLTRPMLQLIPIKNWSRADPFQACAICQEDFKENDKIRVLPCLHGFHAICVDPWLLRRSRRCPCCMQRVRLPNDENDDDDEEETYPPPQRRSREGRSSSDQGGCRITLDTATDGVGDPLLLELAQSPQARYHSSASNPKSESPEGSCTITSPSESRKSSQDIKTLDWQLRRFLQNFNYTPSDGGGSDAGSNSRHGKNSDGKLVGKSRGKSVDENLPSESTEQSLTLASSAVVAPRLLETCLDNSQSGSTDIQGNSTLEVLVGTVGTEDASYHLSSPYPATSDTFTLSTTRDRKTSDATTISGSLPRDESSFHNAEEIHSEIISEEVFDEADGDIKSTHSDQDTTQAVEQESSSAPTKVE
ncbi:unnamed protein product [Orchesella dallaii]|uniref:RING-type domain-containing protein n=1 Tax=Orchesella dallaii TaxID=48710 RepID=A0ABP1QXD7_9HEXA